MATRTGTADRIVDAARRKFNDKGYAAATLTEIAASLNISQGNLTYHYPTKRDLVTRIQEQVAERIEQRRASYQPGSVEDDYVDHLVFAMELTATYRFLLRDDAQIEPGPDHQSPHQVLLDDYAALAGLLERVEAASLFRNDIDIDRATLGRSLWILSRYWMDHLDEMEPRRESGPDDEFRGVEQHFAVLLPNLTADGRRRFRSALERARHAPPPGG